MRTRPALPAPAAGGLRLTPGPAPLTSGAELFHGHPVERRMTIDVDGTAIDVRPVVPGDLAAIDRFITRLSPRSRFLRFHAPVRRLTSEQLAGIVDVDHRSRETIVALEGRRVVALGQYLGVGAGTAELAIVVADDRQRRGLGALVVGQLAAAARASGLRALTASVLAENRAALRLFERWPGSVRVERHGTVLEVLLSLDHAGDPPATDGEGAERSTALATGA